MLFRSHPRTRPELEAVREAESALDVEALVNACVEGRRVTKILPGDF